MYGIYNSHTLEKLINTVHKMHGKQLWMEKLFVDKLNNWYQWYLSKGGALHYAINSILYITMLREKYIKMYDNFINQLKMHGSVIKVLSMKILIEIEKDIQITNPDYDIVIKKVISVLW